MSHSDALKIARNEVGISKYIPITHLNEPTIFELNNSIVGVVIELEGVNFDTETDEILNLYKRNWHQALSALDEQFCVYITVHRQKEDINLRGEFNNQFLKMVDEQYHQQFRDSTLYKNRIYCSLLYKGITSGKAGKGLQILRNVSNRHMKQSRALLRRDQIKQVKQAAYQLMQTLFDYKPRLLGESDDKSGCSELMKFWGMLVNAGEYQAYQFPRELPLIQRSLGNSTARSNKIYRLYPDGNIAQYLPRKRLFFGEYIQFQGDHQDDLHFAAIITIKRYGTETASIMLDPLLRLDCEFISTNSFALESKAIAQDRINKHIARMRNVNDPAVSQINALHEAQDSLASDQITFGHHHNTVLLIADSIEALESNITQAVKCYADAGFVAVRETIGQEPAFWAQMPGNFKYITRSSLISSENFVDFTPMHNYRVGYKDANHLGSAVTLLETPSKTPFYFNYHVKGSQDNPSKGHAIVIGGNNSGKTVFLTFMDAQMHRYRGSTFYFDRDRGGEIYIRACAGYYSILSPDYRKEICYNPFQLTDTPSNRQFCRELLQQLCKQGGEGELDAGTNELLTHCVDYAYESLGVEHRVLSNIVKILPIDFSRWANLRRWMRAHGKYHEGEYAYLFDNPKDKLQMHHTMGFDMTHFLDKEPAHIRTALLMYLFHRIDQALDGQRVSIILDEGWQYFIDPYWSKKLEKWLPTLRKRNGHIIMATQSPSSVVNSPIRSVILDNVATQIFFANPQAKIQDYQDGFNLTESEYQIIANNTPASRLFLMKQEHTSNLCRLNLGHLPRILKVLSANTKTVLLLEQLRKKYGEDPKQWLPKFLEK